MQCLSCSGRALLLTNVHDLQQPVSFCSVAACDSCAECRLEGLLYATGVAYSEEAGVLLDSNELDLALAFTDSVPLLKADMFTVAGPPNMTTTELESVDGSDAYYTFSVTVPESYYGSITVSMDQVGA